MPHHPLRGKSHIICQCGRRHVTCHLAHATSPATRHVTCHIICQRVTPSHISRRHGPRHMAFPLVTNLAMSCDVYTFVTEDRLFHDKGRFVIEKFTSLTNLSISSRWDKCDGICMTNEFSSLIRHKTSSVTF
jgi:hypothetical protein